MPMYRNFKIYNDGDSFIVRADSKRFGKQAIVFESYKLQECIKWMYDNYRNKIGKVITNRGLVDALYVKAMRTCDVPNNPWYSGT